MIDKELQEINPYIRTCVCTRTHPGWSLTNRIIYDHQFVLTSQGKGDVIILDKKYHATKGDLFLIKPGVVHGFIADLEDPFEMIVIHFDFFYEKDRNFWPHKKYHLEKGKGEENIPEKYLLREIPVFEKGLSFPDYIRLHHYTTVEVLMKKLLHTSSLIAPGKELIIKSSFLELLYVLHQEVLEVQMGNKDINGFEKIKRAFEYINEKYMENIKIEELASLCNFSTNYFSNLFKKYTTYSPKEYIMRIRIEKAKALLVQSSQTIKEIGSQVGFNDIHYFSFYFKKFEGISPSKYRMVVWGEDIVNK